jgi:hypothetical protein
MLATCLKTSLDVNGNSEDPNFGLPAFGGY